MACEAVCRSAVRRKCNMRRQRAGYAGGQRVRPLQQGGRGLRGLVLRGQQSLVRRVGRIPLCGAGIDLGDAVLHRAGLEVAAALARQKMDDQHAQHARMWHAPPLCRRCCPPLQEAL